MSDLIERLRARVEESKRLLSPDVTSRPESNASLLTEAADLLASQAAAVEDYNNALAEIERLRAATRELGVKPLEWTQEVGNVTGSPVWRAVSIIGRYTVVGDLWWGPEPTNDWANAADVESCKAAAQADYEQRILSAIELSENSGELPVPTNTVGGEISAETIKRYAWQRLTGSTSLLPVVRDDGDWVKFSDVVDICAANQRLRRSPDTTSRDSAVAVLWDALAWIDTFDPEAVAAAEARFGIHVGDRALRSSHA